MPVVAALIPPLTLMLATIIVLLPWGLNGAAYDVAPWLGVIVVHYWALRYERALPEWCTFLAGLVVDVFSGGPMGFYTLLYLGAQALAVVARPLRGTGVIGRFMMLAISIAVLTVLQWVLSRGFAGEAGSFVGFVYAAVWGLILSPWAVLLLRASDACRSQRVAAGLDFA